MEFAPVVTVLEAPHLFGRQCHVVRPFALEIPAGDFALAAGHPRSHRPVIGHTVSRRKPKLAAELRSGLQGRSSAYGHGDKIIFEHPTCVQEKGGHAGLLCSCSSAFAARQVNCHIRPEGA
jgi:hypothetical protein